MINQDVYRRNPTIFKLENHGVANVNDEKTRQAMAVLRYELETFVCDGEYEKGFERVLNSYLNCLERAQQPGAWISGFYGSGKSHLVKMLRALWVNTKFDDGATARGLTNLPQSIVDHLKELDVQAKRYGGVHAASGTLGASASGSVRLALLAIVFKSVDLPEQYPLARFVMWLKKEGILDSVHSLVEKNDLSWEEELDNLYVCKGIPEALVKLRPERFSSVLACAETLRAQYPPVTDVSSEEMIKAIINALSKDGKFPLTLIALDEIQQFIGEDAERSMAIQEVVETCCKNIGGKLLFIGTGQTALSATSNLKKLEGRFTVRVELSDTDVETVIRKVVLAKKPESIKEIEQVMQTNLGEISRHLSGTTIGHRQDDIDYFAQDYPILPIRRRFWENTLRVLDQTGTESQLRNQLSMIHKVIQTNLNEKLGNVVPADYLYFDSAEKLLQAHILPRKVHEKTLSWKKGSDEEQLMARACGLVFLINKLAGNNNEIGIKANVNTLADLMIEDLPKGSSELRSKLPGILSKCDLLMKVGEEYRIQTEESAAWTNDFLNQCSAITNATYRIDAEREERIKKQFAKIVSKLSITEGNSKVNREIEPIFESQLPANKDKKVYVWVRNGWTINENSIRAEALQAGNQSPTIFVFIPKRSADELRHSIIEYKASMETLERRGVPNSPEGIEARESMNTTFQTANSRIEELVGELFAEAHVYQGGGNEILEKDLQSNVLKAAENALHRLYPQFAVADHSGWGLVYIHAKQGSPDALKAVNFAGKPEENPVCKAILAFIANGKKGTEIRTQFEEAPYGWPRDAVDGGLQVLLVADLVLAQDDRGQRIDPKTLERKTIGKIQFKVESAIVSTDQRIKIRGLFIKAGVKVKPGEELAKTAEFLETMQTKAENAGGEPPKPLRPDTTLLNEIRLSSGNEQLLAIYNNLDILGNAVDEWSKLSLKIQEKYPIWTDFLQLLQVAGDNEKTEEANLQKQIIENNRYLLYEPDMILPNVQSLEGSLRKELMETYQRYTSEIAQQMKTLETNVYWQKLSEDLKIEIKNKCGINPPDEISVGTRQELIKTLDSQPISTWKDRTDALSERFDRARLLAAKESEPKTQPIDIPRRLLKTNDDLETWIEEVKKKLKDALTKGPIVLR